MLHQDLIEKLAKNLKIAPLNIIREYLEMEVLYYLSRSNLAESLIFYGGTALRFAFQSFRFSEDLDFLLRKKSGRERRELKKILEFVVEENEGVTLEEIFEKRWTLFGLLHIKNALIKHPIRIKIEINKKKNGLKSEILLISSPVSPKEVLLRTAIAESIYKLKEEAIKGRNLPRDWFDYWYLSQKLKKPKKIDIKFPFNKKEFSRELKRYLPQDKWQAVETVIKYYQSK